MDMNAFTQLIGNLGFPIAVVIYLFWSQAKERMEHKEETQGFINAIENNTLVIQKLTDKLDAMEDKIHD